MSQPVTAEPAQERSASGARHEWKRLLVPGFLLSLYAIQCVWFIRTQSLTYDEPVHISEGLEDRKSVV